MPTILSSLAHCASQLEMKIMQLLPCKFILLESGRSQITVGTIRIRASLLFW